MKIIRAEYMGKAFYGSLLDNEIRVLNKNLQTKDPIPLKDITLLPLVVPTKIVCVGLNYHFHAKEMGKDIPEEPLLFFKPPSSIVGDGSEIILPEASNEVHYEGELAIVVGKKSKKLSPEQVPEAIFGYSCANDVTARDLQRKDGLYARAKGFDTFCPIGPWLETEAIGEEVCLRTRVNGELKQEGNISDLIFRPDELLSKISQIMTLYPGDVILTGTPAGVGRLEPGDIVEVDIEKIGVLRNTVKEER